MYNYDYMTMTYIDVHFYVSLYFLSPKIAHFHWVFISGASNKRTHFYDRVYG